MLGGGPRHRRRPRILRCLLILYLLVSSAVNRISSSTPMVKWVSPKLSVRVRQFASINNSTCRRNQAVCNSHRPKTGRVSLRCFDSICDVENTSLAQFSLSSSSILSGSRRLSLSPTLLWVSISPRSARSPLHMGLRLSGSHTHIDPCSSLSWLNSSVLYHSSSTSLLHLESIPMKVLCPGSPEALALIPEEHLTSSSILLDTSLFQATHIKSIFLDESLVVSKVIKLSMCGSNSSSVPASRLSSGLDYVPVRLCYTSVNPEKSTSIFIPLLSPLVGRSYRLNSLNPTGVYNPSHCSSRQDRYYLPTPIVLNLYSKFIVDIGVLHGSNSVMVEVYLSSDVCTWRVLGYACSNHHCPSNRDRYDFHRPIVLNLLIKLFLVNFGLDLHGFDEVLNSVVTLVLPLILSDWRLSLIFDQVFYRVRAACLTRFNISVSLSRSILEVSFEGLQRYTKKTVTTFGFGDKLERSSHMEWVLGLCLICSASLIYLLDQKATHRSFQFKWFQMEIEHYICNWFSVFKNLCSLCKRKIEPLGLYYPKM